MGLCTSSDAVSLEPDTRSKKKGKKQPVRDIVFEQLDEIIAELRKNNIGWCNHRISILSKELNTAHYRYIIRHIRLIDVLHNNRSSDLATFLKPFVPLLDVGYIERYKRKFHEVFMGQPTAFNSFLSNRLVTQRFLIYRIKRGYNIFSIEADFKLIIAQGLFPVELFASDFHYFDVDISNEIMTVLFKHSFLTKNTLFSQLFNYNVNRLITFYNVFRANETLSTEVLIKTSSSGRSVFSKFIESENITKSLVEGRMISADLFTHTEVCTDPRFYNRIRIFLAHGAIPDGAFGELLKIKSIETALIHCSIDDLIDYLDIFDEAAKNAVITPTLTIILPRLVRRTDISIGFKLGLLEKDGYISKSTVNSVIPVNFYLFSIESTWVRCIIGMDYCDVKLYGELAECIMNTYLKNTAIYSRCIRLIKRYYENAPRGPYSRRYDQCIKYIPFQRPISEKYTVYLNGSKWEGTIEHLQGRH